VCVRAVHLVPACECEHLFDQPCRALYAFAQVQRGIGTLRADPAALTSALASATRSVACAARAPRPR
jgi:hypothetical protein